MRVKLCNTFHSLILHICQNFTNKFGLFLCIYSTICRVHFATGSFCELRISSVSSVWELLTSDVKRGGFVSEYLTCCVVSGANMSSRVGNVNSIPVLFTSVSQNSR